MRPGVSSHILLSIPDVTSAADLADGMTIQQDRQETVLQRNRLHPLTLQGNGQLSKVSVSLIFINGVHCDPPQINCGNEKVANFYRPYRGPKLTLLSLYFAIKYRHKNSALFEIFGVSKRALSKKRISGGISKLIYTADGEGYKPKNFWSPICSLKEHYKSPAIRVFSNNGASVYFSAVSRNIGEDL